MRSLNEHKEELNEGVGDWWEKRKQKADNIVNSMKQQDEIDFYSNPEDTKEYMSEVKTNIDKDTLYFRFY